MAQSFYSKGKLLITAEYLVLSGAKALAVPLKLGQKMIVERGETNNQISWKSFFNNKCWFDSTILIDSNRITNNIDSGNSDYIRNLILAAKKLNPEFFSEKNLCAVKNF